jgi:hypothetical protein
MILFIIFAIMDSPHLHTYMCLLLSASMAISYMNTYIVTRTIDYTQASKSFCLGGGST